jgi:probable HAF family extracellular repeat protein
MAVVGHRAPDAGSFEPGTTQTRRRSLNLRLPRLSASLVSSAALFVLISAAAGSAALSGPSKAFGLYVFESVANPADPTFDQLLGISNHGLIAGYYGSGADAQHPNKGFLVALGKAASFTNEDYPGAVQTQVVAITNTGNTAGFWVDARGNNHGFIEWNGAYTTVDDPLASGKVKTTQVLGLNNKGVAVGFYNDARGTSHAFKYNNNTRTFSTLTPPNSDSSTATGINGSDEIAGFLTRGKSTEGFLVSHARYSEFDVPDSANTQAFGINNTDEIVRSYVDRAGATHGFSLTSPTARATFTTIDDPRGIGNTTINGVNDEGQLVGFYTDHAMNTIGFLASP